MTQQRVVVDSWTSVFDLRLSVQGMRVVVDSWTLVFDLTLSVQGMLQLLGCSTFTDNFY